MCAAGAQVAALIAERGWEDLDGPVVRVATPDVPIPFSPPLEQAVLPQVDDVREAVRELLATESQVDVTMPQMGVSVAVPGLRQLGLTDDQRQQIRAAAGAHRDEFKSVFERVRTARQAQQAAIEQVPLNEPQIRAASAELAAAEADAAVLRARVHEQVFSLLTPEQQTKAKSLAAERRQFRAQRRAEWQQRMEQFKQQQPSQAAPQQ